jgi:hypothetical protein
MAPKRLGAPPPKRRRRGEYGARVVTSGPTIRKKALKLNEKQSKKWAADKDKQPSSAVWVKRGGRERQQEVHNLIDFNHNLFNDHEKYFEGRDGGILQDPAVLNFRVQR